MPKGHEKETARTHNGNVPESIKDSNEVSNVLNILDNTSIRTNPFGANVSGENSYRRAERIGAAIHLVTNHVPDEEPLREVIRGKGIDLLSIILDLRSGLRGTASEKGQEALAAIRELISLIRLMAISGFISVQNANAIAEAADELGSLIVISQRSVLAEQLTISREQLIPPARPASFSRNERPRTIPAPRLESRPQPAAAASDETGAALTLRSERILDILKAGGTLGIRDIAANLPQYSEKMIQRELAGLVDTGAVQKTGAKRWSRYQIAG